MTALHCNEHMQNITSNDTKANYNDTLGARLLLTWGHREMAITYTPTKAFQSVLEGIEATTVSERVTERHVMTNSSK